MIKLTATNANINELATIPKKRDLWRRLLSEADSFAGESARTTGRGGGRCSLIAEPRYPCPI